MIDGVLFHQNDAISCAVSNMQLCMHKCYIISQWAACTHHIYATELGLWLTVLLTQWACNYCIFVFWCSLNGFAIIIYLSFDFHSMQLQLSFICLLQQDHNFKLHTASPHPFTLWKLYFSSNYKKTYWWLFSHLTLSLGNEVNSISVLLHLLG